MSSTQIRRGLLDAKAHNFWLGLSAVAVQLQAASVPVPPELVGRAARLARLPEDLHSSLGSQPAASPAERLWRAERGLAQVEPMSPIRDVHVAMFLAALVGTALRAGLADSLLTAATLVAEVAEWLSLPTVVRARLFSQPDAPASERVARLRTYNALLDTQ